MNLGYCLIQFLPPSNSPCLSLAEFGGFPGLQFLDVKLVAGKQTKMCGFRLNHLTLGNYNPCSYNILSIQKLMHELFKVQLQFLVSDLVIRESLLGFSQQQQEYR